MSIKEMVKDNKTATFEFFRKGELWYKTECGFSFPVPVSDTGDGEFQRTERALFLMRYIRQHLDSIEAGRVECSAPIAPALK